MISLEYAEVQWDLNAYCKFKCTYCHSRFKNGELKYSVEQYLTVIQKLQDTRYKHHSKILWNIGGGEPLHYPHLSTLLKKMKEKPCVIRLDTSGDDNWFSLYGVLNFLDKVKITYHPWQNDDVFGFALEQCQEKNIQVEIVVPLAPGSIVESKEKAKQFRDQGYNCEEQILYNEDGTLYSGYTQVDENRIFGRPDEYINEPIVFDPNLPDPNYIDLRIVNDTDPVYTGMPCYAGVDWIYIGPDGFVSYSQCGGRNEPFNAFDPNWQPPRSHFACTVNQCRSQQDRSKIRIIGS